MTDINYSNDSPLSGTASPSFGLPCSITGSPAIFLALSLLLSGCQQSDQPGPVSDAWKRVDTAGRVIANELDVQHHCVLDERTELLWEVKQAGPGVHRLDATYSWYSRDRAQHMSEPGLQDGGECDLERCDTEALVDAVNRSGLCGHGDWRLPGREELLTLGDYQLIESGNVLDPRFFPNAISGEYWTASTFRLYPQSAWVVSMTNGLDRGERKQESRFARLVRGPVFNPRMPPKPR